MADFRNKLFSFACLSSRSGARGYFVFNPETTLFYSYFSSFLRRLEHVVGSCFSLRAELRRFITPSHSPNLFLDTQRSRTLFLRRIPLHFYTFRQQLPFSVLFFLVRAIPPAHGVLPLLIPRLLSILYNALTLRGTSRLTCSHSCIFSAANMFLLSLFIFKRRDTRNRLRDKKWANYDTCSCKRGSL